MGYITYVTDQRPGESDILSGNAFADLEIRDSDGHILLKMPAPESGWTHESLTLTPRGCLTPTSHRFTKVNAV